MARFRTLKMPDPDHLVKRLVAGNEVGVLSRLSRASFVGQRFVLINERLKEGEPTRAWGVVQLLQGRAIPSGPKAVETLGAKIDSLTAREFRGVPEQVWYHRLALVERYDPPREIKGTVPGRRYTGSIEMQKAMPKLSAKDEAEKRLEDAKIAANRKLPIATKRHRYVAAKFTLGNHYPRCAICGQTQPLSDWCNAPDMEEAALARQIDVAGSVEKCRYCDEPADSVLIAKEGGAGVPVCASHVPQGMEPDSTLELREIDKADVDPTELKSLSVSQLRQLLRILERDFASRDYNASKSEDLINSALFVMDELQRCREDVPDGQLVEEARKLRKQYAPVGASGEESGRLVKLEEVLNATTGDAVIRRGVVTLVGGVCNHGETHNDLDVLIRGPFDQDTLDVIKFRIGRMIAAQDSDLANRVQFLDDSKGGPFTDHVPLYDLVLVPRQGRQVIQMGDVAKQDDPITELASKPGPKPAVLQAHARGRTLHLDLRLQNNDHLIGWTISAQRAGAVPDINTVQQARRVADTFDAKGSRAFKPMIAPAKLQAFPKSKQPVEWLKLDNEVIEPGDVGATTEEAGVIVVIDRPKWEEGVVRPHYRELFFTGGKHLNGVVHARKLVGRGDGEEQRTPEGETFWTVWLSKAALPSILSTRAVQRGDMPPDGRSWIPQSLEKVTPPEYRYWEHKGDKAREVRDALVKARYFTDSNVRVVDGQFRRVVTKMYVTQGPEQPVAKQDGHVPPKSAQEAARRGLEWRREHGRGGTEIGVARARDLSNGKALSVETLRRMRSYFARHEVDSEAEGWNPGEKGYPSAGLIAWLLWGGDPARAWVERILAQLEKQANEPGIYLVEPHGRLIHTGKKIAMVKERKFDVAGTTYVLLSGDLAYGHVRFKTPREITIKEFESLRDKHQVSDAERVRWWKDADKLWYYEIESYDGFADPRRYARPQGVQTFVRDVRYTKAAADVRRFVLAQQTWKGQQVVRTGPTKTKWFLMFEAPGGELHVLKLDGNPIETDSAVGGIHMHLRSRELMDYSGFAAPGTKVGGYAVNDTKDTPSYWLVLDKGRVAVLDEEPNRWDLQFSGKGIKGRWTAEAEEPGSQIWTLSRGNEPTKKAVPVRDGIAIWDPDKNDSDADRSDLKPLAIFAPQKPVDRNAFTDPDEMIKEFVTPEMLKDGVVVEPKLNGRVIVAERDANGRVVIFFEDTRRDRAKYFPALTEATKALGKPAIVIGEMIDYDEDGDPLPRRELAVYGQDNVHDDSRVKIHAFEVLYWGNENATDWTWEKRKPFRGEALRDHGKTFVSVPSKVVHTENALRDAIKWAGSQPSSEGAMLKWAGGTYSLGGQTSSDAKLKLTRDVRAIVVDKELKKPSPAQQARAQTYVYECAIGPLSKAEVDDWSRVVEIDGKPYTKIGKTFATNVPAERGDSLLVEVTELLLDTAQPMRLNWFTPVVVEKTSQRPMTTREAKSLVRADEIRKLDGRLFEPLPLIKADSSDPVHYVLGVVLEPNDGQDGHPLAPDTQRDVYSEEEVQQAAWRFMRHYRRIGERHAKALGRDKIDVVESYIAPADFEVGGQRIRKGTWMLKALILSKDLWHQIQAGDLNAWSVDGTALRIPQKRRAAA